MLQLQEKIWSFSIRYLHIKMAVKFCEPYLICRRTLSKLVSSFNVPLPGNSSITLKIPAKFVSDYPCRWRTVIGAVCCKSKHFNTVFLPLTIKYLVACMIFSFKKHFLAHFLLGSYEVHKLLKLQAQLL